jgi:hypothetical protein
LVVCSPKPLDTFKGLALVTIQDGKICSLREDLRYDRVLKFSYGEVFSFAKHLTMHILQESKRRSLSPHSFSTFFFPRWLSNSSMTYNRLWTCSLLQITAISGHIFGAPQSPLFCSWKAYWSLIGHASTHVFSWIWACSCQPKHKVFFWLLLKDHPKISCLFLFYIYFSYLVITHLSKL